MIRTNSVGVIAAGGFGTRLGLGPPKSLVRAEGLSLLEHSIEGFLACGFTSIRVYNNRREWDDTISGIINGLSVVTLVPDPGVVSTIELAKHAAHSCDCASICFGYGHAPRPAKHLRRLLSQGEEAVVATTVAWSSKRHLLQVSGKWIEPPYVLPAALLRGGCPTWETLLGQAGTRIITVPVPGPPEPNWPVEMRAYVRYIQCPRSGFSFHEQKHSL